MRTQLRPQDTGRDDAFLSALYASTRSEEMALTGWNDAQKASFLRMQFDLQSSHYHRYFPLASFDIVLLDEKEIGRLYVDRSSDQILLIDIALLPEYRGSGIGSSLLQNLLTEAATSRKPVRIHVERNNPAQRLYRRLGFQLLEDQGVYFLMEWRPPSHNPVP